MTVDFEQTKRDVGGRSILITSWFDDQKKNWRASAPSYAHLATILSPTERGTTDPTRTAAIDRVLRLLTAHFAGDRAPAHEQIIFL